MAKARSTKDKMPLFMWKMTLLNKAIQTWGVEAQLDMVIEECSELIVAIQHLKRDRATLDNVAEEMADVHIMLSQFRTINGVSNAIHVHEMKKLERLSERLEKYLAKHPKEEI